MAISVFTFGSCLCSASGKRTATNEMRNYGDMNEMRNEMRCYE